MYTASAIIFKCVGTGIPKLPREIVSFVFYRESQFVSGNIEIQGETKLFPRETESCKPDIDRLLMLYISYTQIYTIICSFLIP